MIEFDIALRALAVVAIVSAHGLFAHADDLRPDYLRDVRPVLAANCFACHGPDAASREGGLRLDQSDAAQQQLESGVYAIVPRSADRSELVRRIESADADTVMPPPHYHTSGLGHAYQQRYKSFPIQDHEHSFVVCRYVERNALRAGLVARAEDWRWGSLWRWLRKTEPDPRLLSPWRLPRLTNWVSRVNEPLTKHELDAVRLSAQRGRPIGDDGWAESIARRLHLESTMRPRGRQRARS